MQALCVQSARRYLLSDGRRGRINKDHCRPAGFSRMALEASRTKPTRRPGRAACGAPGRGAEGAPSVPWRACAFGNVCYFGFMSATMTRAYRYRCDPSAAQRRALESWFGPRAGLEPIAGVPDQGVPSPGRVRHGRGFLPRAHAAEAQMRERDANAAKHLAPGRAAVIERTPAGGYPVTARGGWHPRRRCRSGGDRAGTR